MLLKIRLARQKKTVPLEKEITSLPQLKSEITKLVQTNEDSVQMSFIDIDDEVVEIKDEYDFEYLIEQAQGEAVINVDVAGQLAAEEEPKVTETIQNEVPVAHVITKENVMNQQILSHEFINSLKEQETEKVEEKQTASSQKDGELRNEYQPCTQYDQTLDLSEIRIQESPKFEVVDTKYDFTKQKNTCNVQTQYEVVTPVDSVSKLEESIKPQIQEALGTSPTLNELKAKLDLLTDIVNQGFCGIKTDLSNMSIKETTATPSQPQEGPLTTHFGVTCDVCQAQPIRGKRFKCLYCPDFDICSTCEAKNLHPHPMMMFYSQINITFAEQMTSVFRIKGGIEKMNDEEMKIRLLKNIAGDKYPDLFYTDFVKKRKSKTINDFIDEVLRIFS